MDLVDRISVLQSVGDVRESLRIWTSEFSLQFCVRHICKPQWLNRFKRTQPLEQTFLESPADRHHLADRLHLRTEHILSAGKLLERPFRDLCDDIIDRRLERRRRLLCNVVRYLVERVADRKFGRDLRDRKAGRF